MSMDRRSFLQRTALGALGAGLLHRAAYAHITETVEKRNGMPYRRLGATPEHVSLLCLGGYHIGLRALSDDQAIEIMRTAIDEGVNFFDNAWAYHGGRSEERMGKALKEGYRDKVFLMTKHKGRDPQSARDQLETSLRRLQVDVIDLWQFHEVVHPGTPKNLYDRKVMEVALKAKEEGKIRYIGCTGHHMPSIQAEMIDRGFPWDTIQMPLNLFDYHFRSYTKTVLPKANERNIGVIAMKTLGGTPAPIPKTGAATPAECLEYAMNLPVATVCSGMDSLDLLRANLATAKAFTPLDSEKVAALLAQAKAPAATGEHEAYKTQWHRDIEEMLKKEAATQAAKE